VADRRGANRAASNAKLTHWSEAAGFFLSFCGWSRLCLALALLALRAGVIYFLAGVIARDSRDSFQQFELPNQPSRVPEKPLTSALMG
jgi:hypothetical protein